MFSCSRHSVSQPDDAVLADAAGIAQPGHRDAFADGDLGHAGTELDDDADALMAGDERRRRLDGPVAMRGMDVGVAQPGRLHVDAHLPELEPEDRDLLDGQRLAEGVDDGGAIRAGGSPVQGGLDDGEGHVGCFLWEGQAGRGTGTSTRWASSTRRLE